MIRSLEIGKRALVANQRGLEVTSNNVANVNTPGYARQQLLLRPGESIPIGNTTIGIGVLTNGIRQFRDQLIERDVRSYTATKSHYHSDATILQRIEQALGEPGDQTIQTAMQRFFDAASQLAANPSRMANRQLFVARAADLAASFNRTSAALEQLRQSTFDRAAQNVERINQLLSSLATINRRINATLDSSGQPAPSLLDQQNQTLQELSQYLDIAVARDATGSVRVTSSGMMLVSLETALTVQLQKSPDTTTGGSVLRLIVQNSNGTTIGTLQPHTGELASLTQHYNETLNPNATGTNFSIARELNKLAQAFADRVNTIASTGYGLNDTGATPPGRALFVAQSGSTITAATISINPALLDDPAAVPTSSMPNTPGNSDTIAAIAALASDGTFLDAMTPEGYYGAILARLAQEGARSNDRLSIATTVLQQVTAERESLSGVNLDEEATNLITYQRAFEAAARVVAVTSDMLATLVNLGR